MNSSFFFLPLTIHLFATLLVANSYNYVKFKNKIKLKKKPSLPLNCLCTFVEN